MKTPFLMICSAVMVVAQQIPVAPEDTNALTQSTPIQQELGFEQNKVSLLEQQVAAIRRELVRVTSCLRAAVTYAECGNLSPDGKTVVRIPKPTSPAAEPAH